MAVDFDWTLPAPPQHLLQDAALFLDFDGTIISLAARPDAIQVDASLHALLAQLENSLNGRLAIISGRPIKEISSYLNSKNLIVAGSHGAEINWPDGRNWALPRPSSLTFVCDELREMPRLHPGVFIEEKPFGVAIHYRQAPEAAERCRRCAIELSQRANLRLQTGKMVFELKSPGANKGSAIDMLMSAPPMLAHTPIFLGDDDTDEAGFAAVTRMGGAGILVGEPRQTAAHYLLPSVQDVIAWLQTVRTT